MRALTERYSIRRRIGQGGVGEVYEGWQHRLERPVAIKLLRKELTANAAAVARFKREARTTCLLRHPNVVTVIDVGTAMDGRHFVVMELLEGENLAALLERRGALPQEEALDIAWQVVRGMGAGQGVGLVHRDLKPENIFVLESQHVKVLDFGLATLLALGGEDEGRAAADPPLDGLDLPEGPSLADLGPLDLDEAPPLAGASTSPGPLDQLDLPTDRLTRPGALMGTPRYMAPEQVLGWALDPRADLYSFGVILFEMLAGRTPFEGPRPRDFLIQHRQTPPPRLDSLVADLPPGLSELVGKLLEKSPSDRFSDWEELAAALRRLAAPTRPGQGGALAPRPAAPDQPYRFLNPFTASSGTIFFGRDADARLFQELWLHPDEPPLIVLTGASGVGKTSFLAARVVPWLVETGHHVLRVRGSAQPLEQLAHQVARLLGRPAREAAALSTLVDELLRQDPAPIAIVLDQLEEVFTSGSAADALGLKAGLSEVLAGGHSRVRCLLSMREDYLGAVLRALHPLPVDLLARTLPLRALESDDIRAALVGPGRPGLAVSYRPFSFEPGLVEEIVADLLADTGGEVAPRIQLVGARLWEMVHQEPDPIVIRRHHYRDGLGGARGILARMLDEAIAGLSTEDQGVAKELLRALTHLPGSATSRPAPESELVLYTGDAARRPAVLRQLEDRWRVVHGYSDARWPGERVYRIAHEALIRRIRDYGEEGSERNRARQVFHQGISLWIKGGQQDDDLLTDSHFDVVQRHIADLVLRTAEERRFYEASQARHNEGWLRRRMEERNQTWRRQIQLTLVPATLLLMGLLLGQAMAGFVTLRVVGVRAMSAVHLPNAPLQDARLREARLAGVSLPGADLRGADLTQADLSGAHLARANLSGAHLAGANLSGADLKGATLQSDRMWETSLARSDLRKARLEGDLSGADLRGAVFDFGTQWPEGGPPVGAIGPGGSVEGLDARGQELEGLDLVGLKAAGIDLSEARLTGSSLFDADLQGARLDGAMLDRADLSRARLTGASLQGAQLNGCQARNADFGKARLQGASLREADLRHARFVDADLSGADLSGATLDGADWTGATDDAGTRWPAAGPRRECSGGRRRAPTGDRTKPDPWSIGGKSLGSCYGREASSRRSACRLRVASETMPWFPQMSTESPAVRTPPRGRPRAALPMSWSMA